MIIIIILSNYINIKSISIEELQVTLTCFNTRLGSNLGYAGPSNDVPPEACSHGVSFW